jgi:hypothetical protein
LPTNPTQTAENDLLELKKAKFYAKKLLVVANCGSFQGFFIHFSAETTNALLFADKFWFAYVKIALCIFKLR